MGEGLSASSIVRAVAEGAAERITRKVIADLQQMTDTMSGDDSGLKTTWDEICVQVQGEESFYWDAYEQIVYGLVARHIIQLSKHEREAIWLQTGAGFDWDGEDPEEREVYPVCDDDIINWLIREYVYSKAENWSNARIEACLARSIERDEL